MADYARTYFGKSLTNLQYTDIERFFAKEHSESDQIEFKSFNPNGPLEAKLLGIIEGVTAFLNSSGGLLIWGAPEGVKVAGKREKVFMGNPTKLPLTIEKDWLISKIADKIIPLPRGFRVQLVACADGQIAVFEVEESPYSPHQTDNRYYMRIDGQNKPAPHHYIEALFNKVTFPRLEAFIRPGNQIDTHASAYVLNIAFAFFNFSPFLNEEKLSYKIALSAGQFREAMRKDLLAVPNLNYSDKGRGYHSHSINGISVRFGDPHILAEELYFEEAELKRLNGRVVITVIFGGKTAPMKFCRYRLRFSPDRLAITYSIEHENRLASDLLREQGRTDESVLGDFGALR